MRRTVMLVALVGCTTRKDIREAHELHGQEVEVIGQHGQVTAVVVAAPDGVTFTNKYNGLPIPSNEIDRVESSSGGAGALHGLLIGGATGALLGIVLGASGGDDDCNDDHGPCFFSTAEEKAKLGGVVLGGAGAVVGLLVGAMAGSTTRYEREGAVQAIVKPVGPPGSVAGMTISF